VENPPFLLGKLSAHGGFSWIFHISVSLPQGNQAFLVEEGAAADMPICNIPFKNLPGYLRLLLMSDIP
jgi:hypothetical protein